MKQSIENRNSTEAVSFSLRLEGVIEHAEHFPSWIVATARRILAAGDFGERPQREWDAAIHAAVRQSRRHQPHPHTQGHLFGTPDLFEARK